jgi:anti-sigma regulatory factor (Ser/Thr protein kinase)/predicted transcriptional regulator
MKRLKQIHKVQELVYELKIRDAAVAKVLTVSPETMMSELRAILRSRKITAAPVVKDGMILGIISVEDYINWLSGNDADCPVSQRMSRDLITMYDDEAMVDAISNFEKYRYYEFPVLDRESGTLSGIITKFDVIVALLRALDINYYQKEIKDFTGSNFFNDVSSDETVLNFKFDVPGNDFKASGEASSKLKKNLGFLGMHPDIIRRVAIATYEAEMNLIIYGGGGEISVCMTPQGIEISVSDRGPGIPDIEKAMKPGFSTASDWVRELGFGAGMGLPNIKRCAAELDIRSAVGEGTTLIIKIPLDLP